LEAASLLLFGQTYVPGGRLHRERGWISEPFIRNYYACFNERRIADAEALFAPDAVLDMPPFVRKTRGRMERRPSRGLPRSEQRGNVDDHLSAGFEDEAAGLTSLGSALLLGALLCPLPLPYARRSRAG
jgi:hypothetical protein